jgi:RNA polymerase sigma-70 factor (ECF subfamily)
MSSNSSSCRAPVVAVPTRQSFDAEYVRRLTRGDPEVERHFTAYFSDLLWLKLRSRLRSLELIHDVRQETFLRVLTTLRRKGGLEFPERLGAFVNAVCNNVLFEAYRTEARFGGTIDGLSDPPDPARDPETAMFFEDHRDRVRQVLTSLPQRDQDVLRMIFVEDVDRSQVCRRLQIADGYLRVLLHRAKARLRTRLSERFPGCYGATAIPWRASA